VLRTAETMTPAKRPRMNWILVLSGTRRSGRNGHSIQKKLRNPGQDRSREGVSGNRLGVFPEPNLRLKVLILMTRWGRTTNTKAAR
jgi:hypothetical protein